MGKPVHAAAAGRRERTNRPNDTRARAFRARAKGRTRASGGKVVVLVSTVFRLAVVMPGPSQHGQRNKKHNSGKHQSKHSWKRHKTTNDAGTAAMFGARARAGMKVGHGIGNKQARAIRAKQIREANREAMMAEKRYTRATPRVVAVLAFNEEEQGMDDLRAYLEELVETIGGDNGSCGDKAEFVKGLMSDCTAPRTATSSRHRHRASFLLINPNNCLAALESLKVCDLLMVVAPVSAHEPSSAVAKCLPTLKALGIPQTLLALRGLDEVKQAKKQEVKKAMLNIVANELQVPTDRIKNLPASSTSEFAEVVRQTFELRSEIPRWRSQRPYVLTHRSEIVADPNDDRFATVVVEGYVRGVPATANQLWHLPGVGDFPVQKIESIHEPREARLNANHRNADDAMDGDDVLMTWTRDPEIAEDVMRENQPDDLAGEQTWPTASELEAAEMAALKKSRPAGMSAYQASWLLDEDADGDDDGDDDDADEDMGDAPAEDTFGAEAEMREGGGEIVEDDGSDEEWVNGGDDDEDEMDPETRKNLDMAQRDSNKRALLQDAENEDLQFPDEMDTPAHCKARDRFAKYRGLKSFRSSPWDPKESLPFDYSRVFAFENFRRAHKRALEIQEEDAPGGAQIGTYVRITIAGVPHAPARALFEGQGGYEPPHPNVCPRGEDGKIGSGCGPMWTGWVGGAGPVVLSGLLQFESCLSLMNYCVTKSPYYDAPLKTKDPLWFHVGFRRERAGPLYSTDNLGDKHKLERFLRARSPTIASVYGPITYGPAPVIGFKESFTSQGIKAELAVTGTVRNANPDRIILKRVILSAIPFRTHKHKAVARHMFYDPNDIRWFKPLELWTKFGLRGKIVEPVGTHGRMKCIFNSVIHQHDTICTTLYKRVYPKFAPGEHSEAHE